MSGQTDSELLDAIELQQQLDEKNQLVSALTERLEDAAEQLDRIQRSGGDRGGRSGGGMSAETAAQQQTLIEQLTKSVDLWDDVHPRDAFDRIEARLDELREMMSGAVVHSSQSAGSSEPVRKEDPLSGWEKMKAELMGGEAAASPASTSGGPTAAAPVQPSSEGSASSASSGAESTTPGSIPAQRLDDLDLPKPVDFEIAERADLETAIETRDQFIGFLVRRLRSAEDNTHEQIDWDALNNAPDELCRSLQVLEVELNDRLRIAEVDLSLERARLSRVETRIRGMQKQIEQRLAAAGHSPSSQSQDDTQGGDPLAPPKKDPQAKNTWFGAIGR